MRLYRLNASVLELSPRASDFLKAYATQTPEASRGAFIDAKGKAVAVYNLLRPDPQRALIVVARDRVEPLQNHLKKYLFLTDNRLELTGLNSYWHLTGTAGPGPGGGEFVIRGGGQAGAVFLSPRPLEAVVTEEEFKNFRLDHSISVQGIDFDEPMLLNLADPGLVSFEKGCYLGQEIMARVHYKGRPPLKLEVVDESACPLDLRASMTSKSADPATGRVRGFVFRPTS